MEKSITNIESHTRANINTDHFPLVFTIRLRLKHMNKGGKTRPIYKPCTSTQQNDINHDLLNTTPETNNTGNNYNIIKHWLKQGIDPLPKSNPKDKNQKI